MDNLINEAWRAYVRQHISAEDLRRALIHADWGSDAEPVWHITMARDAVGQPVVMTDDEICDADDVPEPPEGYISIACPVDETTTKEELLEFDAADASDWEDEWEEEDEEGQSPAHRTLDSRSERL